MCTAESDVLMLQGLCRWQVFIALTWAAMRRRRTVAVYTPLTLLPRARERDGERNVGVVEEEHKVMVLDKTARDTSLGFTFVGFFLPFFIALSPSAFVYSHTEPEYCS